MLDLGAMIQQQLDHIKVPVARGAQQGRPVIQILGLNVSTTGQKFPNKGCKTTSCHYH